MSYSSAYNDKLRDPRWQKLRLQVFERDGWKCLACGDKESTLAVHHLIYGGKEPWEIPMEFMETLCESCHAYREDFNHWVGQRSLLPTRYVMWFSSLLQPALDNPAEYLKKSNGNYYFLMECLMRERVKVVRATERLGDKE